MTKYKIEHLIRFLIIIIVFVSGSFTIDDLSLRPYVMFVLLFTLVCQIRLNFITDNTLYLATLFFDIGLVFYIYQNFDGFSYLLIYITLVDILIFLHFEAYLVSLIISGFLTYFLKGKSIDSILLNIIIFSLTFTFANQIKKMRANIFETESLYDMNRNYSYELEEAKKRVEVFARMVEEISHREERNKISREIHDSVGHELTGTLLQLEAYIRISETDAVKSKELLHTVRDKLRECTEHLRQAVRGMNPKEYTNFLVSIQQMTTNFEKATGVNICFEITGNRYRLNSALETALYKNTQEALTNSVRHGKSSKINIELKYLYDKIELIISDNGSGCDKMCMGMGISGMEERSHLLGGKIEFQSLNGFIIKTIIPINQEQVI